MVNRWRWVLGRCSADRDRGRSRVPALSWVLHVRLRARHRRTFHFDI